MANQVWIALAKNAESGFWEPTAIAADRQQLLSEPLVIRGKFRHSWGGSLEVKYGLEQFFVPQNEGKALEREMRNASVEVAVDEKGASAVVRFFVGDEAVEFH